MAKNQKSYTPEFKQQIVDLYNAGGPIFVTNSFIKRRPVSEDKSPPSKFILICLLLLNEKVFKISIERPFFRGF